MRLLVLLFTAGLAHAGAVGVGDPAPGITLSDRDGRPVALEALRGGPVLIDFWATWCGACKRALPALDAIARRHAGAGLRTLAVNIDQSPESAERFLAEHLPGASMTLLHDPGGTLLRRWGAGGMPALYLVDAEGVIRLVETGYAPERLDAVERAVRALLAPAGGARHGSAD
jgi:cytochrome c biogenesis protein CcmG/thiol:disulfide interchange protein DsbE